MPLISLTVQAWILGSGPEDDEPYGGTVLTTARR